MVKEKAIMMLVDKSRELEAVEAAIQVLGDWKELEHLKTDLKNKLSELSRELDELIDEVNGSELDIDKALEFTT